MNFEEFKEQVFKLPEEILSIEGKRYQLHPIEDEKLPFLRKDRRKKENATKREELDLHKLHKFYTEGRSHTTTEAKSFGLGGKQSPAVAVIKALKQN